MEATSELMDGRAINTKHHDSCPKDGLMSSLKTVCIGYTAAITCNNTEFATHSSTEPALLQLAVEVFVALLVYRLQGMTTQMTSTGALYVTIDI